VQTLSPPPLSHSTKARALQDEAASALSADVPPLPRLLVPYKQEVAGSNPAPPIPLTRATRAVRERRTNRTRLIRTRILPSPDSHSRKPGRQLECVPRDRRCAPVTQSCEEVMGKPELNATHVIETLQMLFAQHQ
jgi:hypothetical protein